MFVYGNNYVIQENPARSKHQVAVCLSYEHCHGKTNEYALWEQQRCRSDCIYLQSDLAAPFAVYAV